MVHVRRVIALLGLLVAATLVGVLDAGGAYASTPQCAPGALTSYGASSDIFFARHVLVPGTSVHAEVVSINTTLYAGDHIYDGPADLVMQSDGNLVVYGILARTVGCEADWASNTYHLPTAAQPFQQAVLDTAGNFYLQIAPQNSYHSIYSCGSQPTSICNHNYEILAVQDDGNVVLYNTYYTPWHAEWATNTAWF